MVKNGDKHSTPETILSENHQLLQDLMDNSPALIYMVDREGRFILVNSRCASAFGMEQSKIVGKTREEIIAKEIARQHTANDQKVIAEGTTLSFEEQNDEADGLHHYSTVKFPLRDEQNSIYGIAGISWDVTEIKKAEEDALHEKGFTEAIFNSVPGMLYLYDTEGHLIRWNSKHESMTGYSTEELSHMTLMDWYKNDTESQAAVIKGLESTMATGFGEAEAILQKKDGSKIPLYLTACPLTIRGKQYFTGIGIDITERKRAEKVLKESERRFSNLFERAPLGYQSMDENGCLIEVNAAWLTTVGYAGEQIRGKWFGDFLAPEYVESFREQFFQFKAAGKIHAEFEVIQENGNRRAIAFDGSIDYREDGTFEKAHCILQDITDRRESEKKMQESEEKYRTLLEFAPDAFFQGDSSGKFLTVNNRACEITGYTKEELLNMNMADIFPASVMNSKPLRYDLLKLGNTVKTEREIKMKTGSLIPVDMSSKAMPDGTYQCFMRDVSERKQAEQNHQAHLWLLENMDQINQTVQGTNDLGDMMSKVLDTLLSIFNCQRAFLVYPCDPEAPSWKAVMERTAPEYPGSFSAGKEFPVTPDVSSNFQAVRATSRPVTFGPGFDHPLSKHLIETHNIQSMIAMAIYPKGDKPYMFGLHQCSYPRVWTEDEKDLFEEISRRFSDSLTSLMSYRNLQESEAKYRCIFDTSYEGILGIGIDSLIAFVNNRMTEMLGYSTEEIVGHPLTDFMDAADIPDHLQKLENRSRGISEIYERKLRHKNGHIIWVLISATPNFDAKNIFSGSFAMFTDITERKRVESEKEKLQGQLAQSQKLESIGRLAGGVAHDYNNMLSVIIGYTELALGRILPGDTVYDDLREILAAAKRSVDLTRQLLAFARKQTIAPVVLDLNGSVEGMLKMLNWLIGEDIKVNWHPDILLWPIKMDPSQIDQILANLCVNARDAIAGMGTITIETAAVSFDTTYCAEHADFFPGEFAMLAVSDDGCGMDKDTISHIFEPFFTTKELGHGTGLGLATVYGIVRQNDGFINVYSEPGRGTTFKVYLPRYMDAKNEESANPASKAGNGLPAGKGESILLVEDEPALLSMGKLMLEKLGYRVLTAGRGRDAMQIAEDYSGSINLLITDVIMPEMNGKDLADRMSQLDPGMKALFMSGYTAQVIAQRGVLEPGVQFLQKPFSIRELAVRVRQVLDSEQPPHLHRQEQ